MSQIDNTIHQNALAIANIACFAAAVLRQTSSAHISKTLGGDTLTRDQMEKLVAARIVDQADTTSTTNAVRGI